MAIYMYWYILALVLIGLEMMSGTFYLLIIGIALALGGTAALYGLDFTLQLTIASVTGSVGIILLWYWRKTHVADFISNSLDVGQPVKVLSWHEHGKARVFYRGAEWDAELAQGHAGHEGVFYIQEIKGSVLVLTKHKIG